MKSKTTAPDLFSAEPTLTSAPKLLPKLPATATEESQLRAELWVTAPKHVRGCVRGEDCLYIDARWQPLASLTPSQLVRPFHSPNPTDMPTTVTAYFTNGSAASIVGLLNLDTPSTSILRMAEVSGLLGSACELFMDEPGYTVYVQENAADSEPLNPVVKTPDGQPMYGNILIIDSI